MIHIIAVSLLLLYITTYFLNIEKFTVLDTLAGKYDAGKFNIINKSSHMLINNKKPIVEKIISDDLLTDLLEKNYENDDSPDNVYDSNNDLLNPIVDDDEQNKKVLESTADNKSIFTIEEENKILRNKLTKERYNQNVSLEKIKNELLKLLSLKEDVYSLEEKSESGMIKKLKKEINKLKKNTGKKNDIVMVKLYNNLGLLYESLYNINDALKSFETALEIMHSHKDYKSNYYTGLTYHNRGLIYLKLNDNLSHNNALKDLNKAREIYIISKSSGSSFRRNINNNLDKIKDHIKICECKLNPKDLTCINYREIIKKNTLL